MSVATQGDPDGVWTYDDPEASLDLLAIRSLHVRNSEDDVSFGLEPLFHNETDLEAFVRDFTIDDAISDCFAGLPPPRDDSPGTSSFMPLVSQPEKKLVSPGVKVSHSSHRKRGNPAASDPPAVVNDSAGHKTRGFLASLLARGVKGFKAEGRNKKPPPHQLSQLPSNALGKDPPFPHNPGVSLAEGGHNSALCDDSSVPRDPLLESFLVDGDSECLFEDVNLAHRDETVSGLRGISCSDQSFHGDKREVQSPGIYDSNDSVGKHAAAVRDTTTGKRSHAVTVGKPLPVSDNLVSRQHGAAEDKAVRKQHVSQNNEANVSVPGATVGKQQTQGISAGRHFHVTNNAFQRNREPNKETSVTSGRTSIHRSATNKKNNKPAADPGTQSVPLEERQTGPRSTETRDSPPEARRGLWEGLIQGIDSFIDFERDPSLEIPLDFRLTSQFDFERDSSLELESLDSRLASQFELFDAPQNKEGGTQDSPLPSETDFERAPDVRLPRSLNHSPESDNNDGNGATGDVEKEHKLNDRIRVCLKTDGLPPSGKAFAASRKAFSSHKVYAARGQPIKAPTGSLTESANKDSASECSLTSSDVTSKTPGSALISSQRAVKGTQTEYYCTEAESKGRAASYIHIAMTQLSNLSSYSACSEIVSRTMSHLQRALLELSSEVYPSGDFDSTTPHKDLTRNSLAAVIGDKTDSSDTRDSPFPLHEPHVLYANNNITTDSQIMSTCSSNSADTRSLLVDGINQKERSSNRKLDGAVELTSAEPPPATENVAEPVGFQDSWNFAAEAHTKEMRSVAVSLSPSRTSQNLTDNDRGMHLSRDGTPTRPYRLSSFIITTSTTPTITTHTSTTTTATSSRRRRDPDPAMTSSSNLATSRDTDSTDSTSTVTSEPNTVKAARHQQRETTMMRETTTTTTQKKKNPNKQKSESRVSPPLGGDEESLLQSEVLRPPAEYADDGERSAQTTEHTNEGETLTVTTVTDTAVLSPLPWSGASKGHHHEAGCSVSSCSRSRRKKREAVETAILISGHWKRQDKIGSVSSIDTAGYKTNNLSINLSKGPPPYAGAMVGVQRGGEGGGDGDCESFLTSSWSEMTSVSSVCDVITSADESSYYSGDDDEENDDEEEEEEDEATPVVRLGLQDEDQDESELRHHRLQRHLAAVLRQASTPTVTIETVVAATGERLNSQERHFNHINQGVLYPFSSPGPSSSAYEATPTDDKTPPYSASEGGGRAGPSHGSEKTASTRPSRAFASSIAGKKGGATPRLFSPERQVSQVEARQMTSDQFRESYDRSSDIAKVKRSQLDGDIPWDLLQFSDTDDDAASDHAWYDVTSEEESAAHAYSTDTDSSAAASDW